MQKVKNKIEFVSTRDVWYKVSAEFKEHNDCAVIALAIVLDTTYAKCHAFLKKNGRRNKRGTPYSVSEKAIKSMIRYRYVKGPYSNSNKKSLKKFCQDHPEGRFLVGVRGHALAVIDGVIHDHKEGLRRQVIRAYRIYKPGEIIDG